MNYKNQENNLMECEDCQIIIIIWLIDFKDEKNFKKLKIK